MSEDNKNKTTISKFVPSERFDEQVFLSPKEPKPTHEHKFERKGNRVECKFCTIGFIDDPLRPFPQELL